MTIQELEKLELIAQKATKGKFELVHPDVDDEEMDRVNHGGWRTDSYILINEAFDPINEESYEKNNTPHKYRRTYSGDEKLVPEISYRGPAQTHANGEYLAALDPDTVLALIKLAKKSLEG